MVSNSVPIKMVEDDSVKRKLQKTAKKLSGKYSKTRKINEKQLERQRKWWYKLTSALTTVILVVLIAISLLMCVSTIFSRVNKTVPTFAGYCFMQIATGSMAVEEIEINGVTYDSGHPKGENIVVHSVDTSTLNVGDKIAFYVYTGSFTEYYQNKPTLVDETSELKYRTTTKDFFGLKTEEILTAAKANSKLVFHHIVAIYEEEDGTRWFKTKGSSNGSIDYWVVKEDYVVGIYDDTKVGQMIASVLKFLTSKSGLIVMIASPLVLFGLLVLIDVFKNIGRARLELDVVEEKRKITDPICVKNDVGYKMDKKTKLKVLAQAEPDEKLEYISLLWKDGTAPNSVKKYAVRKSIVLVPNRKLLELHRECEDMFRVGLNPNHIAKHYLAERKKIEEDRLRIKQRLKVIAKSRKK